MFRRAVLVALIASLAGCGIRAPSRIDVAALVRAHGPVEARRELTMRTLNDPRDVAAKLALAALAEQQGRPSGAIEQLEAVVRLGGPIGTRWHADDRARLARLLAARGRVRIARGAGTALADLSRAGELGMRIDERDTRQAKLAGAITQLRHVDARTRAAGVRVLRELATTPIAEPSWAGAAAGASPLQRGMFGAWLWGRGARRAAWEELAAWHAGGRPAGTTGDESLETTYLAARSWWMPADASPPDARDLVGNERCRFGEAACHPSDVALIDGARAALLAARPARTSDPVHARAWLVITLIEALAGNASWGPAFTARVELGAISNDTFPAGLRAAFTRLAGRELVEADTPNLDDPASRYLVAAGRALHGESSDEVASALGPLADNPIARALLGVVAPPAAAPIAQPYDTAAVAYVRARAPSGPTAAVMRKIVDGYRRDPAVADRLALDAIAEATDDAAAHAALGSLFDALADPARARASWQAAVDSSAEPPFMRGLAEAIARAGDGDAALVVSTSAAASSGDPAVVWAAISRALEGVGVHVHALEAARYAIDLAGPDVIAGALEAAMGPSQALGRASQVDSLRARRATVAPPVATLRDDDPTDAPAALAAFAADPSHPTSATVDRLWTASRWNPRDVALRAALRAALAAADPRRNVVIAELVALAADRDPERGRAAVAALR